MSAFRHYVFQSIWHIDAPLDHLYAVLSDITSYPKWWPEIRTVTPLGDNRFEMVARSTLPYELRFISEEDASQRRRDVIHARLYGDLEGFARWTIVELPAGGCRLIYDQEVDTNKRLLDTLAPVARPAFKANHTLMMRHGQAGLRTYVAGYLRGVHGPSAR
jgi:ribosome-associated toxin RatA of RatAB toxin-antitoxin module